MNQEKLYVFGGSFDPFHIGHEAIVSAVLKEYGQVLIIPTQNPWKPVGLLSLNKRIEILKEFYKDQKGAEVSDLCLQDPEFNYMYKVVEHYSHKKIVFVMGEDSYKSFPQWKNYDEIKDIVDVIVFKRNRDGLAVPNAPRVRVLPMSLYQNEISSTVCRQNLKKNKHLIPLKIFELMEKAINEEKA